MAKREGLVQDPPSDQGCPTGGLWAVSPMAAAAGVSGLPFPPTDRFLPLLEGRAVQPMGTWGACGCVIGEGITLPSVPRQ